MKGDINRTQLIKEERFIYLANIIFKKSISRQEGGTGDFTSPFLNAISTVYDCSRLIEEFAYLWKL